MRFRELLRNLDGGGLERAAAELLRLLDGGTGAAALPVSSAAADGTSARRGFDAGEYAAQRAVDDGSGAESVQDPLQPVETERALERRSTAESSAETERLRYAESAEAAAERRRLAEALDALSAARQSSLTVETAVETTGTEAPENTAGTVRRRSAAGGLRSVAAPEGMARESFVSPASEEADMDAISEFFRRDSRRYDSGFGG